MQVTQQNVSEVIKHLYTAEPQINEDFTGFYLRSDLYSAEVVIHVFDASPTGTQKPASQGMRVWIWFCSSPGERLNLASLGKDEMLDLCYRLQDEIDWGIITPVFVSSQETQVALTRSAGITFDDICKAMKCNPASALISTLNRLAQDWEALNPLLVGVATGQVTSTNKLELLLQKPASSS